MRTGSHGETLPNNFPLAGAAGSAYCIIFIFFVKPLISCILIESSNIRFKS